MKLEKVRNGINDLISEIEDIVLKHQTKFSDETRQLWIEWFLSELMILRDKQESDRFIGEKIKELFKEISKCQK